MKLIKTTLILIAVCVAMSGMLASKAESCFSDIEEHEGRAHIELLYSRGIVKGRGDMLFQPDDTITVAEFTVMLLRDRFGEIASFEDEWYRGYMDKAIEYNICDDYDRENAAKPLNRQIAAKMLHSVLVNIYCEEDVEWSAAENLKDLYSCHTCVMHIAQVYVKGIMDCEGDVFNLDKVVTRGEAAMYTARIIDPSLRAESDKATEKTCVKKISYEQAKAMSEAGALLIDVRSHEERNEGFLEGSISLPADEIISGCVPCDDKERVIIVYCASGTRSRKACAVLSEKGYTNVYDLGAMPE